MTEDSATTDRRPSETSTTDDDQFQIISAVTPSRLAAPTPREVLLTLRQQDWWETAQQVAGDWQAIDALADFWEIAVVPRVQYGRAHELAGLIASAGEQLALALAALTEAELWRGYRRELSGEVKKLDETQQRVVAASQEMTHRAMAEMASYYLLATGHAVANVTIRALALDTRLHPVLLDSFGGWSPVKSQDTKDWLSLNRDSVRTLRRVAKKAPGTALQLIAEPASALVLTPEWEELNQLRGVHYHRRRPQSAGIAGVPLNSPWVFSNGTASMDGGGREYLDGEGLAHQLTDIARRVLSVLSSSMGILLGRVNAVIAEIQQERRPHEVGEDAVAETSDQ